MKLQDHRRGKRKLNLTPVRCSECGRLRQGDILNSPLPCPDHPEANLIPWPTSHQRAFDYLTRDGTRCAAMWEVEEEQARRYYPGVDRQSIRDVTQWALRWPTVGLKWPEPHLPTPNGLFGARGPSYAVLEAIVSESSMLQERARANESARVPEQIQRGRRVPSATSEPDWPRAPHAQSESRLQRAPYFPSVHDIPKCKTCGGKGWDEYPGLVYEPCIDCYGTGKEVNE